MSQAACREVELCNVCVSIALAIIVQAPCRIGQGSLDLSNLSKRRRVFFPSKLCLLVAPTGRKDSAAGYPDQCRGFVISQSWGVSVFRHCNIGNIHRIKLAALGAVASICTVVPKEPFDCEADILSCAVMEQTAPQAQGAPLSPATHSILARAFRHF